jgi:hypothetical protein
VDNPAEDIQQPYDTLIKELAMSTQYVDFITKNPLFERILREREAKGFAEGETEMILQLLHTHFSEATAELVELALHRVDIRDAEVIRPLKEAAVKLDEQGVKKWVKDHLPAE